MARKKQPQQPQPKSSAAPMDLSSDSSNESEKENAEDSNGAEQPHIPASVVSVRATWKHLRSTLSLLLRGVEGKDQLLIARAVRRVHALRKCVTVHHLRFLVAQYCGPDFDGVVAKAEDVLRQGGRNDSGSSERKQQQQQQQQRHHLVGDSDADAGVDVDSEEVMGVALPKVQKDESLEDAAAKVLPEVRAYIVLLGLLFALDRGAYQQVAQTTAQLVAQLPEDFNRRTLDHITARIYYYYALSHELTGRSLETRSVLLRAHRTACLRHDEPGQAVLTNAILRHFLQFNLVSQADKFRLNVTLPDNVSSDQQARFLYYLGRINSVQLHYSEAFDNLSQAIRKANVKAVGFSQAAHKLLIIVQLLMGEIPERSIFALPHLERSLKPYLRIAKAVRVGDLAAFKQTMDEHARLFEADGTATLIVRLRQNVIKTGLRKLNISYSRISLADICAKLKLEDVEDAESIVAKAIHDDVIDATIERRSDGSKSIYSKQNPDVYSTNEPQNALHKRITVCMDIHNSAVKSMRFPPDAHKAERQKKKPKQDDDDDIEDAEATVEELLKEEEDE